MKRIEEGIAARYDHTAMDRVTRKSFERQFVAGAEWMREELLRWHDPKESRPKNMQRILVKYKKADGRIRIGIATFHHPFNIGQGSFVIEGSRPRYILGWREIHENE